MTGDGSRTSTNQLSRKNSNYVFRRVFLSPGGEEFFLVNMNLAFEDKIHSGLSRIYMLRFSTVIII